MACHIASREAKGRHVSLSSFLQRGLRVYIRLAHSHETINPTFLDKIYPHPHTHLPIPSMWPWATTLRSSCGTPLPRHCFNPVSLSLFSSQSHPCPFTFVFSSRPNPRSTWSPRFVTYFLLPLQKYSNLFVLLSFFIFVTECIPFRSGMYDFSWVIRSTNPLLQRVSFMFISREFNSLGFFFSLSRGFFNFFLYFVFFS